MKQLLALAVAALVVLGAAACGDDADTVTTDDSSDGGTTSTTASGGSGPNALPGPDEVVWESGSSGGLVAPETDFASFPDLIVLGDGRVIRPAVTTAQFPGPAVRPLEAAQLAEGEVQEILTLFAESGLTKGTVDFGTPGVTDLPTTTVTSRVDDRIVTLGAYALGVEADDDEFLTPDQRQAREALQALIADVSEVVDRPERAWTLTDPPELLVFAFDAPPADDAGEPVTWPLDPALVQLGPDGALHCAAIAGPDLATLLEATADATQQTPWLVAGEVTRLAFRPHYPYQEGCPD